MIIMKILLDFIINFYDYPIFILCFTLVKSKINISQISANIILTFASIPGLCMLYIIAVHTPQPVQPVLEHNIACSYFSSGPTYNHAMLLAQSYK